MTYKLPPPVIQPRTLKTRMYKQYTLLIYTSQTLDKCLAGENLWRFLNEWYEPCKNYFLKWYKYVYVQSPFTYAIIKYYITYNSRLKGSLFTYYHHYLSYTYKLMSRTNCSAIYLTKLWRQKFSLRLKRNHCTK